MKEPKKNCFAYRTENNNEYCKCLNRLYCRIESCKFYKEKRKIK